jgi:hypothetical protein
MPAGWRALLAAELRHAADVGEIAELDVALAAYQIDVVLIVANTAFRIGDEEAQDVVDTVRRVAGGFLVPPHRPVVGDSARGECPPEREAAQPSEKGTVPVKDAARKWAAPVEVARPNATALVKVAPLSNC